ncbi:MAG: helicase-associated domain-containing protein [Chloroflexota bacterium]|nr:helicase-associated domain-containing protein [Chloroflexota bacterium]
MPTLETLTKADLRGPLKAKSLRRARRYIKRVQNPARSGHTLTAQVRGSRLYEVEIDVTPDGISALCSCPYDWGGYCKHIGALLLKWIRSPGDFAIAGAAPTIPSEYPIEVTPVEPPPTQRPDEPPSWLTTTFAERIHADEKQLRQWLTQITLRDLRGIAKQRGWKVKGTRKAGVVRQVYERIADPRDMLQTTRDLDEEHRLALRALVLLGARTRIRPDALEEAIGAWGGLSSYQNASTCTHHLCEMGLALPGDVLGSYNQSDFVPHAIGRALHPLLKNVIPTASHPRTNIGELRLADPRPFVRAVNQVALLLEQYPTPLRAPMPRPRLEKSCPGLKQWDYDPRELARAKSSGSLKTHNLIITVPPPARSLPDKTVERLVAVAGDEARLEFIYSLLTAAGVLQPGSPVTIWTEIKNQFLRQSELAQRAILAQTYFRMMNWSALWELLREGGLQLWRFSNHRHFKPDNLRTDLVLFRHTALRSLASLPDGEWAAIKDLFRLMRAVWPRFDHSVWQNYWRPSSKPGWFLGYKHGLSLDSKDASDWDLAQGRFIRHIITGPLHWLGLADLCFDDDGALAAVRFHGLADLYWDRVEIPPAPPTIAAQAPSVPAAEALTIEKRTISIVPSTISAQAHDLLHKIARLEAASAERFVYQLDSQTTYESFETGAALSEILDGWAQMLPIPVPEAIRDQLTAWWSAYGRVRIYEGLTVIEFGDDYALREMKAVTSLEKLVVAEISPRLVIVPQEAVAPLAEALEKAGYTPKQTDEV